MDIQLGNTEIRLEHLMTLAKFGDLYTVPDEGDTLYLKVAQNGFTSKSIFEIIVCIAHMLPDECTEDAGVIRFWWD